MLTNPKKAPSLKTHERNTHYHEKIRLELKLDQMMRRSMFIRI